MFCQGLSWRFIEFTPLLIEFTQCSSHEHIKLASVGDFIFQNVWNCRQGLDPKIVLIPMPSGKQSKGKWNSSRERAGHWRHARTSRMSGRWLIKAYVDFQQIEAFDYKSGWRHQWRSLVRDKLHRYFLQVRAGIKSISKGVWMNIESEKKWH